MTLLDAIILGLFIGYMIGYESGHTSGRHDQIRKLLDDIHD